MLGFVAECWAAAGGGGSKIWVGKMSAAAVFGSAAARQHTTEGCWDLGPGTRGGRGEVRGREMGGRVVERTSRPGTRQSRRAAIRAWKLADAEAYGGRGLSSAGSISAWS
jgi:hypothetical protein